MVKNPGDPGSRKVGSPGAKGLVLGYLAFRFTTSCEDIRTKAR